MADATVICSIERLFDWEAVGEAVIGVTLSMAWGNIAKAPPDKLLLPWNWLLWPEGPEKLGFYWACYAPSDLTITPNFSATAVFPQPLTRNGRTISSIRNNGDYQDFAENGVRPRYDQIRKKISNLGYPQGGQDNITVTATSTDGPGDASQYGSGARWPSILADLSTRPAPIPHALLLAFIFKLGQISDLLPKRSDGSTVAPADCSLFIAPVLKARATGKASDTNPVTDPAAKPLSPGSTVSVLWNYSDAAYQASCQTVALGVPPPQKSFFDMRSRLVRAPGQEKWHFKEDWQSSFESRLAERLDASAELLRVLEHESFDDATARNVVDAAIAALRDIAGIGFDLNPGNISFLQASGVDPANISAIGNALPSSAAFKDVAGWKAFLQKAFATPETTLSDSYLAGLDLWGSGPIKSTDAVRQLDRVRQKVLAPDALWALLQLQISSLVPGANVKQPADLNTLPATLRDENLGRYWRTGLLAALAAPGGTYSADKVRLALENKMQAMAIARFRDTTFFPRVTPAVAAAAMAALSTQTSRDDWTAAAKYAIPDAASMSTEPGAGAGTLAAHGITIQINEIGDTSNLSLPGSDAAEVRRIQGVGLLLGHDTASNGSVSTSGYNCLNYADVCYLSASERVPKSKILERAALVPLRFTWRNGVAVATVSYNNEPLPAPGPLSRAAKLVSPGGQTSDVAVGTDLLWYSYPTNEMPIANPEDPRTKLTALIFGRDYHPQPFLVSNSGALPNSLATGYLDLKWGDQLDKATLIGETWETIPYRRQHTPGALRMANVDTGSEKHLKLPAIPEGVFPRVQSQGSDQPVVMLVPDQDRFTTDLPTTFAVNVRPPATDLLTWDRFVNGFGNSLANTRSAVISGFLAEIRRHSDQKADITIDDPATVYSGYDCRLYFELLDEDGSQVKGDFMKFPAATGSGVSSVQAAPLTVSFVAAKDETKIKSKPPSIEVKPASLTVTVFEGRFARLRLHACVHKDYAERFEQGLLANVGTLSRDYYLLPPTEIFLEVVTNALPSETDLFDGQKFQIGKFNILDGTATVSLDLAGMTNEQYVYSAEVLRQVWRWQGRPVLPLPPTGDISAEWLTREFGTRDQADFLRVPMLPPADKSRTFTFTEERGSFLSDADRASANLRPAVSQISVSAEFRLLGTYIRYGVQAESRYKPLVLKSNYVRGKGADGSSWRDFYIPSRKLSQIKAPDVKLILPLTRNAVDPDSGPGILVMIRGPWFQECGLGERLEARIMLVETPEENPASTPRKTVYYQYGPDPILTRPIKLPSVLQDQAESGWGNQRSTLSGPVGHTFDTVSAGQLFLNTSFVLNYPTIGKLGWTPWAFCQIQVRRVVDVIGKPSPTAASDWSPPTWIQLLPDFDRYSADGKFADLILNYQSSTGNFRLINSSGQSVAIMAGNGDSIYANYLAITHFVSDVTGKLVQEAYDGLYRQSGLDWVRVGNAPQASVDVQSVCRARVLTVQGKNPVVTNEDAFWGDVFSIERHLGDPSSDLVQDVDRLRIVSVSRPIDVANSPYRGC